MMTQESSILIERAKKACTEFNRLRQEIGKTLRLCRGLRIVAMRAKGELENQTGELLVRATLARHICRSQRAGLIGRSPPMEQPNRR